MAKKRLELTDEERADLLQLVLLRDDVTADIRARTAALGILKGRILERISQKIQEAGLTLENRPTFDDTAPIDQLVILYEEKEKEKENEDESTEAGGTRSEQSVKSRREKSA